MSKKFLSLVTAALIFLPLGAQAGNGYIGASVGNMNYQEPGTSLHALNLTGRLGYRLASALDVEVRAATATSADNGSLEFSLNSLAGAYIKLNWSPMQSRHFEIYLIGGGTYISAAIGPVGTTATETDSSGSYGIGFDFFGNDSTALNLEWMRYGDGEIGPTNTPYTLDTLTVGLVHHF